MAALYVFEKILGIGLHELYLQNKDYFIPFNDVVQLFNIMKKNVALHKESGCSLFGKY